jgi:hypothetical protein
MYTRNALGGAGTRVAYVLAGPMLHRHEVRVGFHCRSDKGVFGG